MASPLFESQASTPPSPWSGSSPTFNRSYLLAAMRAAVIAVVLLGVLALIVLF